MVKHSKAAALRALRKIPNVGPAVANDLWLLGIRESRALKGQNPKRLYDRLCQMTGHRQDPCVLDTFLAVVDYAKTGVKRNWWEFTAERKRRYPSL